MNKHAPITKGRHHPAECLEILCSGSFKIHWDMDISHTKPGNNAPLVWNGVIGCWESEIDDRLEPALSNHLELRLCGLTSSAEPVAHRTETINIG